MKTTRAMLVIGVLMLILAVIVAQGLRPEESATVSGPIVSGAVSHAPPPLPAANPATSAHAPVASSPFTSSGGVSTPLHPGTLKLDSTTPASQLAPINPAIPADRETNLAENNETDNAPATHAPTAVPGPEKTERKAAAPRNEQGKAPGKLVVTTAAPKTLTAGQKAISRTRLEIAPQSAIFRLTGGSALKGKAFTLKEPDRIVVDLDGFWGINLGRTPANPLIKSVRAGSQETNTRLVFDLYKAPKSFKLVQVDPRTLELQMR